jgi:hypothetical protein
MKKKIVTFEKREPREEEIWVFLGLEFFEMLMFNLPWFVYDLP